REEFFAQQSLLWEQLVDILELFSTLPQTLRLTLGRAAELLELALGTVQIATPPRTLDQVSVGLADRMRPDDPKAVVLLGVIEGEFPAVAAPGGLLSDAERRRMVEGGLELLAEGERFLAQERMLCYRAVTAAAQTLLVCAPRAETTGEPLSPSAIWLRAAALSSAQEEEMSVVQTADSAMAELAVSLGDRGVQAETLRVLAEDIAPEQLTRLWRAREKSPHRLENRSVAQRLFGSRMRLSPSRLERYYSCPFSYFAQSGLRLRPRRKAELSPLETGTLVHRVLEQMVSQHGGKGLAALDDAAIQQEIDAMTRQYLSERLPDPGAITKRLEHSFRRVGEWLFELVRRLGEEFSQSRFEPIAFEMPIGEGQTVEPLVLTTASGTEILVEGTVDRVDVAEVEGRRYVRVIDYKSGGKSFSLSDVYHGLNMQMLLYLFSIWQNGEKELENVLPAGILYAPALGKYHAVPRGDDGGQLRRAADAQYRMNGLLLSDPAVLSAMEADGKGIFIPVRAGQEKSDALASLAELGRLRRLVEDRVIAMADQLAEGEIAACPSQKKNDRPCRFCDYRGICGFEEGDPVRPVLELDRAVLLAEGENDG
ncbi:MAG: PD-(D/E)XK nuclease family protein, partial [Oscillospiraceae bacterium]